MTVAAPYSYTGDSVVVPGLKNQSCKHPLVLFASSLYAKSNIFVGFKDEGADFAVQTIHTHEEASLQWKLQELQLPLFSF